MVATAQHLKIEIKNFTKMHEIIHHYFDYTTDMPNNEKSFDTLLIKRAIFLKIILKNSEQIRVPECYLLIKSLKVCI